MSEVEVAVQSQPFLSILQVVFQITRFLIVTSYFALL